MPRPWILLATLVCAGWAVAGEIIVAPAEEEGILSPRNNSSESRARDNRLRARQAQTGKEAQEIEFVVPGSEAATTRSKAGDLRSRAAGYSRGSSRIDPKAGEGLPVIVCKDVESVAGRIGDDVASGSVIVITRDGKPMKVRCQ